MARYYRAARQHLGDPPRKQDRMSHYDYEVSKHISAQGGRYHFKDDWQFYDTLVTNFTYDDKIISWEGKCRSCSVRYLRRSAISRRVSCGHWR